MVRKRKSLTPESDDGIREFTSSHTLSVISDYGSTSTYGARRRQPRQRLSHNISRRVGAAQVHPTASATESSEHSRPASPAGSIGPSVFQQGLGSAQLYSPPAHDQRSSVSYEAYLANVMMDLDSHCIVVATDDKLAQCIAIASYDDSDNGLAINVWCSLFE